jgi:hypothetical protein
MFTKLIFYYWEVKNLILYLRINLNQNMNKLKSISIGFALVGIFFFMISSCKHDPVLSEIYQSNVPIFTGDCNSDTIYYERDIAPILNANCATSKCHDASTAKHGVDLSSYSQVIKTGEVIPFNANGSELVEVLSESGEDQMPPPPLSQLPNSVKSIFSKWINQGAYNFECSDANQVCDTLSMSYIVDVLPILTANCIGCHSGSNPEGGLDFSNYSNIKSEIDKGKFMGSIEHSYGYVTMPYNSAKLAPCKISKIRHWVNEGALDN